MPPGTQQVNHQKPLRELAQHSPIAQSTRYNLKTISNNSSGVTA